MLPAANRLRSSAEFLHTTRQGRKAARSNVVVYLCPGSSDQPPRVGTVTGKSVGNSVQRHRAARRMRAAIKEDLTRLPNGSHVVLRALVGADRATDLAAQIHGALDQLLARAGGQQ